MKAGSNRKEVRVEDAVGMVLAHDLTQIIPGQFKGRIFKKGHVIREEDIPKLLDIGKRHVYALELADGEIHEDEAALRMAMAVKGENVTLTEPREGKVNVQSEIHGLAKINKDFVDEANSLGEVVMSTIKTNTVVHPGQTLVGTRVIPLVVEEAKVREVERLASHYRSETGEPVVRVKPFLPLKVGLITTGSEVVSGRIEDKFGPVVRRKVNALGSEVVEQVLVNDEAEQIVEQIRRFLERKVDLILVTGGMSVDPDDRTPGAIQRAGARIVSYGTPMLPGSMLMMAYLSDVPIMGLPGCVMHDPFTSFDVLLPRVCAGETITKKDIVELGYGGFIGC